MKIYFVLCALALRNLACIYFRHNDHFQLAHNVLKLLSTNLEHWV